MLLLGNLLPGKAIHEGHEVELALFVQLGTFRGFLSFAGQEAPSRRGRSKAVISAEKAASDGLCTKPLTGFLEVYNSSRRMGLAPKSAGCKSHPMFDTSIPASASSTAVSHPP